jgi:uncharacterized protein (TIGR02268 family)
MSPCLLLPMALWRGLLLTATPAPPACQQHQRIELSQPLSSEAREICIRPGMLTGVLFDVPVTVDLQDEVRFAEVLHGARGISFVPPPDLTPGERLRLTVRFTQEPSPSSTTFLLVSHPGHVTHQVDVVHDDRSRDTLLRELEEERARNQRLLEHNLALRTRLERPIRLSQLVEGDLLGLRGVEAHSLVDAFSWRLDGPVSVLSGRSYRSQEQLAVVVLLRNNRDTPWTLSRVSWTNSRGTPLENVDFVAPGPIEPRGTQRLILEASLAWEARMGRLSLEDEEGQGITLHPLPEP